MGSLSQSNSRANLGAGVASTSAQSTLTFKRGTRCSAVCAHPQPISLKLLCGVLGFGLLWPWQSILNSLPYYSNYLDDGSISYWAAVLFNTPQLPVHIAVLVLGRRSSPVTRLIVGFSVMAVILGILPFAAPLHPHVLMAIILVAGCSTGVIETALFGCCAMLPTGMDAATATQFVLTGEAVAALLANGVQLAMQSAPEYVDSMIQVYFGIAALVMIACTLLSPQLGMRMMPRHHSDDAGRDESHPGSIATYSLHANKSSAPKVASRPSIISSVRQGASLALALLACCWRTCISVFINMAICFAVFPGVIASIRYNGSGINGTGNAHSNTTIGFFLGNQSAWSLLLFGLFSSSDLVGRLLSGFARCGGVGSCQRRPCSRHSKSLYHDDKHSLLARGSNRNHNTYDRIVQIREWGTGASNSETAAAIGSKDTDTGFGVGGFLLVEDAGSPAPLDSIASSTVVAQSKDALPGDDTSGIPVRSSGTHDGVVAAGPIDEVAQGLGLKQALLSISRGLPKQKPLHLQQDPDEVIDSPTDDRVSNGASGDRGDEDYDDRASLPLSPGMSPLPYSYSSLASAVPPAYALSPSRAAFSSSSASSPSSPSASSAAVNTFGPSSHTQPSVWAHQQGQWQGYKSTVGTAGGSNEQTKTMAMPVSASTIASAALQAGWTQSPLMRRILLIQGLSWVRLAWILPFILAARNGGADWRGVTGADFIVAMSIVGLGLTNGHAATLAMVAGPKQIKQQYRDSASVLHVFFRVGGLWVGSLIGTAVETAL